MIDCDWRVHDTDGPVLVAAIVENAAPVPRWIALEPRTEGSVLPPRRRGIPERGWSDDGFSGVVPAEGRLALGFASTGPLEDPPVTVTDEGRADEGAVGPKRSAAPSPSEVLRDLGSPLPPRDAIPDAPIRSRPSPGEPAGSSRSDGSGPSPDRRFRPPESSSSSEPVGGWSGADPREVAAPGRDATTGIPAPVADWLDDVAARLELIERLAENRDLDGAAATVDAVGGLAAVERLVDAVAEDEAALRAAAERAATLADDCERRDEVPVAAYRRLA